MFRFGGELERHRPRRCEAPRQGCGGRSPRRADGPLPITIVMDLDRELDGVEARVVAAAERDLADERLVDGDDRRRERQLDDHGS